MYWFYNDVFLYNITIAAGSFISYFYIYLDRIYFLNKILISKFFIGWILGCKYL